MMMICLLFRACGGSEERRPYRTVPAPSMGEREGEAGLDLGVVQPLEWRHYSWHSGVRAKERLTTWIGNAMRTWQLTQWCVHSFSIWGRAWAACAATDLAWTRGTTGSWEG